MMATGSSSPIHTPPITQRKLVTVRRISAINSCSERGLKEIQVDGWIVLKSSTEAKKHQVRDLPNFKALCTLPLFTAMWPP